MVTHSTDAEDQEQEHKISILLVDDNTVFVEALKEFLERETVLQVIGVAYNGEQALKLVQKLHPSLILLDLAMPDISGLELLPEIRKLQPTTRIIVVTLLGFRQIVKTAGADDYVEKRRIDIDLLPAIYRLDFSGLSVNR
jgi:DNA-binding NarL/FixJ family response regulator